MSVKALIKSDETATHKEVVALTAAGVVVGAIVGSKLARARAASGKEPIGGLLF